MSKANSLQTGLPNLNMMEFASQLKYVNGHYLNILPMSCQLLNCYPENNFVFFVVRGNKILPAFISWTVYACHLLAEHFLR